MVIGLRYGSPYAEVPVDENWDSIADWYAALVRDGSPMHRFSRDILLSALPPNLAGLNVLDVGCGEGLITRALAARGATALGVDPTSALVDHARAAEEAHPVGAIYRQDNGETLSSIETASIDLVTAGLSLNNIPDLTAAVASIKRVLKRDGALAFTVPHPCFDAPYGGCVTVNGTPRRLIGDYLAEGFWRSTDPHSVRRAGNYHRTIATYVNLLTQHGFAIGVLAEPVPDEPVRVTNLHRAGLPPFLLIRTCPSPRDQRGETPHLDGLKSDRPHPVFRLPEK
jgi:ubiquinone/menaquinone biosynthesis C-methylase UbiE